MVTIDNERCLQCGTCVGECHRKALSIVDDAVVWNSEICMGCGHCVAVCPRDCIMLDGDGYDIEEVEDLGFAQMPTSNQIRNAILARRSVREFSDIDVTEDEIKLILEAGKYAPTAMNLQENAFVVVRKDKISELQEDTIAAFERRVEGDASLDEKFKKMMGNNIRLFRENGEDGVYYNAPVVIFVFGQDDVDASICATNMGFMINSLQLGFCFARIPTHAFKDAEFAAKWGGFEGKKCPLALLIGNTDVEYFSSVPRKTPPVTIFA